MTIPKEFNQILKELSKNSQRNPQFLKISTSLLRTFGLVHSFFQIRKLREDTDTTIAFVVNHTANTAWYEKFSKFIQDVDYHSTYNDTTDFSSVITKLYEDIKSTVVVKSSTTDLDDPNQISIDFRGNCLAMQNSVS